MKDEPLATPQITLRNGNLEVIFPPHNEIKIRDLYDGGIMSHEEYYDAQHYSGEEDHIVTLFSIKKGKRWVRYREKLSFERGRFYKLPPIKV